MPFRKGNRPPPSSASSPRSVRAESGSILPLIALALIVIAGFLAITIDLMRNFQTVRQLQFAADSAAIYGLSYATDSDGSYTMSDAQSNIAAAIKSAGLNSWNSAQSGPDAANDNWQAPVTFSDADITFVSNPNPQDSAAFFVQLKARRDGDSALKQFFLPAVYAAGTLTGGSIPSGVNQVNTYRISEVVGQPAARIGAGAPLDSPGDSRAAELVGFAALPLAVSNQQFAAIADPTQTGTTYTVDLVDSASAEYAGEAPSGHVKGCLANLAAVGDNMTYYGTAQGDLAIDQLEGLLNYFGATTLQTTLSPGIVERGAMLAGFDPGDPTFQARKGEISAALAQIPQRYYLVPVTRNDPSFSQGNEVVGFARLKLNGVNVVNGAPVSLSFDIGESVPVRNASFANGLPSVPSAGGSLMPAPVAPFLPLQIDPDTNGLTPRPRGVVLAPAISPRVVGAG